MKRLTFLLLVMMSLFNGCDCPQQNKSNNTAFAPINSITKDISMYPKVLKDENQHIIELPNLDNESNYKVEIFVAKEMEVDCNDHFLAGALEEKDVKGWGYNYYTFKTDGSVISTMMACPDNTLTKKDVYSKGQLVAYNSKLPIVIYTPEGYNVKYKIWNVLSEEFTAVETKMAKN